MRFALQLIFTLSVISRAHAPDCTVLVCGNEAHKTILESPCDAANSQWRRLDD